MRIKGFLFLIFCSLTACDFTPKSVLKVGTNIWSGYETLYLARSLGYYPANSIKMVELPSATKVAHAFQHQLLDVAALTLDEALVLLQTNGNLRIILVMDVSHGGDVLLAKPEFTTLNALKGKRIGVENVAVGAILLDGALSAGNLTVADINIVPMPVNEHLLAYQENKIDAVVTFEPVKSQLLQQGALQLFDSSRIPNRIMDVLVTRQHIIEQKPAALKALLKSYFKALDYWHNNPQQAAVFMADRLEVKPNEVAMQFSGLKLPTLEENLQLLSGDTPQLKPSLHALVSLMLQRQLLRHDVSTTSLLNGSLLPHHQDKP